MLPELPGRLEARIASLEFFLEGDPGGDIVLSTAAAVITPLHRGLRANNSLSICSAETMV